MNGSRLLVVEDDSSVRSTIVDFLEIEGYQVEAASSTREALAKLDVEAFPIVLSDIYLDERTGLDVLKAARKASPACAVILMTARGTMETVMRATEDGAFEYLAKPFELDDLLDVVKRAEETHAEKERAVEIDDLPETALVGSSPAMVDIYKTISRVAPTLATVLFEGETGTGKELLAREVHRNSQRREEPFVAVDCGAIASALMESELFGVMRGAFTGADRDRIGVFESAHKGTVFLDEIGEMEPPLQLRLLRFLQEREVRPVGASKSRTVDVRVVAATNRDLQHAVEEGTFREDLWFRLNVVRIHVPPLRERRGDIKLLAYFFVQQANERYHQSARLLDSGLKALEQYLWPGNVRQMQHVLIRLAILAPQGRIDGVAVESALREIDPRQTPGETLAETEIEQIKRVLAATGGNKSRTAKILGIERKTLYRKLERMGLSER